VSTDDLSEPRRARHSSLLNAERFIRSEMLIVARLRDRLVSKQAGEVLGRGGVGKRRQEQLGCGCRENRIPLVTPVALVDLRDRLPACGDRDPVVPALGQPRREVVHGRDVGGLVEQ